MCNGFISALSSSGGRDNRRCNNSWQSSGAPCSCWHAGIDNLLIYIGKVNRNDRYSSRRRGTISRCNKDKSNYRIEDICNESIKLKYEFCLIREQLSSFLLHNPPL